MVVAEIGIADGRREEAMAALIEKWASGEALAGHGATDHIQALGGSGTLAALRPSRCSGRRASATPRRTP